MIYCPRLVALRTTLLLVNSNLMDISLDFFPDIEHFLSLSTSSHFFLSSTFFFRVKNYVFAGYNNETEINYTFGIGSSIIYGYLFLSFSLSCFSFCENVKGTRIENGVLLWVFECLV